MPKLLKKNCSGYGYNYTDLNSILAWLETQGIEVSQEVKVIDGNDYIVTTYTKTAEDGTKEVEQMLGCRIVMPKSMGGGKVNECQQYGSAITYMRRYSIVMNLGLGSDDDDAACCNTDFPRTQEDMLAAIQELAKNESKKNLMKVVKKKLGLEKPVAELSYDELKAIYQTVAAN